MLNFKKSCLTDSGKTLFGCSAKIQSSLSSLLSSLSLPLYSFRLLESFVSFYTEMLI